MKITKPLFVALLTLGALTVAAWSMHLGRKVWSPRVFAWRNFFRQPPKIAVHPDSPLLIINPRYYSFASFGSTIGGVLRFEVVNRSSKPVHSYDCRYYSPEGRGNGAYGAWGGEQETSLLPGRSTSGSISAHEYVPLTLTIDFIQFADGTTWFSLAPDATTKPAGMEAGRQAAAEHLLKTLERDGAAAVLKGLPEIHVAVQSNPFGSEAREFGSFGFHNGVTNMVVRVRHAHETGGLENVEAVVRRFAKGGAV